MRPESRARGTAVHNMIQAHLTGQPTIAYLQYAGFLTSFERFAQEQLDTYVFLEKRLHDPEYGYNGKPDGLLYLRTRDNGSYIGDWKTGGMQKTYPGQIAGYWHLARANGFDDCVGGFDLMLYPDGKAARPVFVNDIRLEFNYFLNALAAFKRYAA